MKYATLPLDLSNLRPFMDACIAANVRYGLGAKDPTPKQPQPIDYKRIDCSGFFREAIIAMGGPVITDGTWHERQFLAGFRNIKGEMLERQRYEDTAKQDGSLRVCVALASPMRPVGHIWMCLDGVTYESYGGHGPGMRAWDTPILRALSPEVWVLARSDVDSAYPEQGCLS